MIKIKKYKVRIDKHEIKIPNINKDLSINFLSDIHVSDNFDTNKFKYIKESLDKNCKYICFVGDNLDSTNFIRNNNKKLINEYYNFIKSLAKKYKVFINRSGVHDMSYRNNNKWQKDTADEFWERISHIEGVYLSGYDNFYEDDNIIIYNLEAPYELYINTGIVGEDKELLKNELKNNKNYLNNLNNKKTKILLLHTPRLLNDIEILELIKEYDIVLSGHMHNGMMPTILDKLIKGNRGIISPDRKLFPDNTRGIKEYKYNDKKIYNIISGGVTKLAQCTGIFNKFNNFYPISINYLKIKK